MTRHLDEKSKELIKSIEKIINKKFAKFQAVIVVSVNTMITSQIEAINQHMIATIQAAII